MVARRILDSLTPGWEQIGAVWLPLPHLLNMLPIQIDHLYRTGGSAIAISVLANARSHGVDSRRPCWHSRARAPARRWLLPCSPPTPTCSICKHADDRAVAVRSDDAAGVSLHLMGHWRSLDDAAGSGLGDGAGVPHALRSVADHRRLLRHVARLPGGGGAGALRDIVQLYARLAIYPAVSDSGLHGVQSHHRRRVVRQRRVLRSGRNTSWPAMVAIEKINEGVALLGGGWLVLLTQIALVLVALVGLASVGDRRCSCRWRCSRPPRYRSSRTSPATRFGCATRFRSLVAATLTIGLVVGLLRRWALPIAVVIFGLVVSGAAAVRSRGRQWSPRRARSQRRRASAGDWLPRESARTTAVPS